MCVLSVYVLIIMLQLGLHPLHGPEHVHAKYWSFDTLECLLLMEGIVETYVSALTSGKVFHLFCKVGRKYDQGCY